MKNMKVFSLCLFVMFFSVCCFAGAESQDKAKDCEKSKDKRIDEILTKLSSQTSERHSLKAKIEYLVSQPLFESKTLRKGMIYYFKDAGMSALRIDFESVKQDEQKELKELEQYIFDGVWLTRIDHQMKNVKKRQFADANSPVDPFELASREFPIIGFTRTDDLKKDFDLSLVNENKKEIHIELKVKDGSYYDDDYTVIDFWIDKKLFLPVKIQAVSTEEDVYQIQILKPKINCDISKEVFDPKYPADFVVDKVIRLEDQEGDK